MALRNILTEGNPSLYKVCRPYGEFNQRLAVLLDDMAETMKKANGVGLAAPQVGIARRCCVVLETNVEDEGEEYIIELVNPEIIAFDGEQEGYEGCLSFPNVFGETVRPMRVKVEALDENGNKVNLDVSGEMAKCLCHEIDHLDGIVFVDKVTKFL